MSELWDAEEIKKIAEGHIANRLPELVQAKIKYLFKEKCSKSAGKLVIGDTKKASPKESFFAGGCDYILVFGADGWEDLNGKQREAAVLHYLCYCHVDVDEETNEYIYKIKKEDVREFTEVFNAYGLWNEDLQAFGKSIKNIFDKPAPIEATKDEKKKDKDAPVLSEASA